MTSKNTAALVISNGKQKSKVKLSGSTLSVSASGGGGGTENTAAGGIGNVDFEAEDSHMSVGDTMDKQEIELRANLSSEAKLTISDSDMSQLIQDLKNKCGVCAWSDLKEVEIKDLEGLLNGLQQKRLIECVTELRGMCDTPCIGDDTKYEEKMTSKNTAALVINEGQQKSKVKMSGSTLTVAASGGGEGTKNIAAGGIGNVDFEAEDSHMSVGDTMDKREIELRAKLSSVAELTISDSDMSKLIQDLKKKCGVCAWSDLKDVDIKDLEGLLNGLQQKRLIDCVRELQG